MQTDNNSPVQGYAVAAVFSAAFRCKVTLLLPTACPSSFFFSYILQEVGHFFFFLKFSLSLI